MYLTKHLPHRSRKQAPFMPHLLAISISGFALPGKKGMNTSWFETRFFVPFFISIQMSTMYN